MPITLDSPPKAQTPGDRLRALRIDVGLSPEQLGVRVGISGDTIRRIELGIGGRCPHPRTMFLLADAFDLHVIDIWTPEALVK